MPAGGTWRDIGTDGDGGANLAKFFLGFTKELFGFVVLCGVFAFFGKGLGVWDKVEVAKVFLAFAGELDGHH